MRLKNSEIDAIKNVAYKFFGADARVYLFGSRVDDTKRGGDIDIFIETAKNDNILQSRIKFLVELEKRIGEQKIDVIVKDKNSDENMPIYYFAKQDGILL